MLLNHLEFEFLKYNLIVKPLLNETFSQILDFTNKNKVIHASYIYNIPFFEKKYKNKYVNEDQID